jgi:hypothetical protein
VGLPHLPFQDDFRAINRFATGVRFLRHCVSAGHRRQRAGAPGRVSAVNEIRDGLHRRDAGHINAFDQEGVELGTKFTFGLLGRRGFESFAGQFEQYEKNAHPRCAEPYFTAVGARGRAAAAGAVGGPKKPSSIITGVCFCRFSMALFASSGRILFSNSGLASSKDLV